jgi:hypothetical protein
MSEMVLKEDAFNGAQRRQRANPVLFQEVTNGIRTAREAAVIEMKPLEDNDLFDFCTGEEGLSHRGYELTRTKSVRTGARTPVRDKIVYPSKFFTFRTISGETERF